MASLIKKTLLLFFLFGCDGDNKPSSNASSTFHARSVDCDSIEWNWTNVGQPFMMTWCTSCHHSELATANRQGAPTAYNFDTYSETVSHGTNVMSRVIDQTPSPMPPAGGPTDAELQRLYEWLECGMPQ